MAGVPPSSLTYLPSPKTTLTSRGGASASDGKRHPYSAAVRRKLPDWLYEDSTDADHPRTPPRVPRFWPSFALFVLIAIVGIWWLFVSFARLMIGDEVHYFWLKPDTIPSKDMGTVVGSTVAAVGVFVGLFPALGFTAFRKQRFEEAASYRASQEELLKRFAASAEQLGNEQPSVRIAGLYAMARLADDWPDQRQVCVNVLCGYVRMPWDLDDRRDAQVHQSLFDIIRHHLEVHAKHSWSGLVLDFSGATIRGFDLSGAVFDAQPNFSRAVFYGENFINQAEFRNGADFREIEIFGSLVLKHVNITDGAVEFDGSRVTEGQLHVHVDSIKPNHSGGVINRLGFDELKVSNGQFELWLPPHRSGAVAVRLRGMQVSEGSSVVISVHWRGSGPGFDDQPRIWPLLNIDEMDDPGENVTIIDTLLQAGTWSWRTSAADDEEDDETEPEDDEGESAAR